MMNIIQWLSIALTGATLSFGFIFHSLAAPAGQTDKPLLISISTAQAEATIGEAMSWQISLTPQGRQRISSLELRSGDEESWSWPKGVQTIPVLTNTVVLNVAAIPLVTGNLTPIIEARAAVDNRAHQQVATADNAVAVQSVETQVEAKIVAIQGTVEKEGPLPVELQLHNSSPFTLTQVEAVGSGIDLVWDIRVTLPDIPPGKIMWPTTTIITH